MTLKDVEKIKKEITHNRDISADAVCDVLDIIDGAPTVIWCSESCGGHPLMDLRPRPDCEKCVYHVFTENLVDRIVELMNENGIEDFDELAKRLRGGET